MALQLYRRHREECEGGAFDRLWHRWSRQDRGVAEAGTSSSDSWRGAQSVERRLYLSRSRNRHWRACRQRCRPVPSLCDLAIDPEPMRARTPARQPVWRPAIPSGQGLIMRPEYQVSDRVISCLLDLCFPTHSPVTTPRTKTCPWGPRQVNGWGTELVPIHSVRDLVWCPGCSLKNNCRSFDSPPPS
jgi:hypothetical protein